MDNIEMLEMIQLIRDLTKQLDYARNSESKESQYIRELINNLIFRIDALNCNILQELIENNELGFVTVDLDSLEEWIKKTEA